MIALNTRSCYSFMWGTGLVDDLCRQAKELGYEKIALTDTDNLCGLWPFLDACRHYGITPVIGAEVTDPDTPHRAVCLAKTLQGYHNLSSLISRRHQDKDFCLKTALPSFSFGLTVLTRNPDLLAFWHENSVDLAVNLARHPGSQSSTLYREAQHLGIPLVATPGSFFLKPEHAGVHRMLRAISLNTCQSRLGRTDAAPDSAFLASPQWYQQRFSIQPEAIRNTFAISEKIEFKGPDFGTIMPPLRNPSGIPAPQLLYKKTLKGARKRYGSPLPPKVVQRINYEMDIIREKSFCEYFLVVEDIVKRASRICGRGSGAASIVAYCLGITNVCPIKFNLYFERFLNPDRKDPPDIDVDFAWDERDRILEWVLTEFKGHSAMVSSHILFQPRMAVREVAKVFGLPDAEISRVTKRLPWFWRTDDHENDLLSQIREKPEFRFMEFPEPWPQIMAYARAITGIPRYLSVHPGGVVITPEPIDRYVPVQTAPKGVPLIQWEKDGAETAGLVKIDLLGNRSLAVIRDTIHNLETNGKPFDDFNQLDPEDDYDTQHHVAQGNTMGCFYIESPATRLLQKKTRVGDFEHLVIHSSIIRPAANEFIQEYIKRLHTGEWKPVHPLLEGVLDETYGIMVYQEDVSRVAVRIAGFSHAEGDGLRKIMSKKDKRRLSDYHDRFVAGAGKNNVAQTDIDRLWSMIISFSGYSFCKPHSASYARVSFQAAYLKTHYPAEFMAAVISNQGGFYSAFAYVSEARRSGVKIHNPDVNESQIHWYGMQNKLFVGLSAVRELSLSTAEKIISQRRMQPFKTPHDFFERVRPRENEINNLISCGSMDSLNPDQNRTALLWQYHQWRQTETRKSDKDLFNLPKPPAPQPPDLPGETALQRMRNEFESLGFLCKTHPMELYSHTLQPCSTIKAADLHLYPGKTIRFAGWLITGKVVRTKKGDPMKFLTFEDETGIAETVFFPEPYARLCHMLETGKPYLLKGKVDENWGAFTLTVDQCRQMPTISLKKI